MKDICGINRITPRRGLAVCASFIHRALPYAIDYKAFSLNLDVFIHSITKNLSSTHNNISPNSKKSITFTS